MKTQTHVTVNSLKFDGRLHRSWAARLKRREGSLLILDAVFSGEVRHPILGTIEAGTLSTEYFWTDRWFNVFRFRSPSGRLLNYYCNINTPARFDAGVLSFVDLDIDVLVSPDLSYQVLDEEEFLEHSSLYNYPSGIQARARRALTELIASIENREFPFHLKGDSATPGREIT